MIDLIDRADTTAKGLQRRNSDNNITATVALLEVYNVTTV